MTYTEKLKSIISKNHSHVVVGLDPDIGKIPDFLLQYKNPIAEFNKLIVDSTKDIVAGYKPNLAFYEILLEHGVEALRDTLNVIPDELIKICDAKRGDMGNTASYYATAYLKNYDFDSITLSPYMGEDSIAPFIEEKEKGVYILALTSNPGSKDFQFLNVDGKKLYEMILERYLKMNDKKNIGFVFGANHIKELNEFTKNNPEVPLLIPGIGAQSNDLKELISNLHTKNFVINSSRAIIYSAPKNCSEKEFTEKVRESSVSLNKEINELMNSN